MTDIIQEIALNKLVPSTKNVRRTGVKDRIEELAASIASKGVLQNLVVCPADGDKYAVIAGGRRLKALKLLVKGKQFAKDGLVRCMVREAGDATEVSLAENITQMAMHPADQFYAFKALQDEGLAAEDIAARFGVSSATVTQRLKLAAVSPKLMKAYRAGDMNLDQLSAFAITDDHTLQERVWKQEGEHSSRRDILHALTETQVPTSDRRAVFVGVEAYEASGGAIVRDLFDTRGGGFLTDTDLLNRLIDEKLADVADSITGEGWKWVEAVAEFSYGTVASMRRIYPEHANPDEATQARIDELEAKAEALAESSDEYDESIEAEISGLEAEVEALRGEAAYQPEDIAMAGVVISLGHDGEVRIERGFVKPEDDTEVGAGTETEAKPARDKDALSNSLATELSAYRTAALANEIALQPGLALRVLVHALAVDAFYRGGQRQSVLTLRISSPYLKSHAPAIEENRAMTERAERQAAWEGRVPEQPDDLWVFVVALPEVELHDLMAHCVSLSVDAVSSPGNASMEPVEAQVAALRREAKLDMAAYWQPTAERYFGRVSKSRLLRDVREATSPVDAQTCESMKKQPMAARAEKLVSGKGWLPEQLR
jgi:ParB family chromosome partitioning protein